MEGNRLHRHQYEHKTIEYRSRRTLEITTSLRLYIPGGNCWKWPLFEALAFSRVRQHVQAGRWLPLQAPFLPIVSHVLVEAMHFRLTEFGSTSSPTIMASLTIAQPQAPSFRHLSRSPAA